VSLVSSLFNFLACWFLASFQAHHLRRSAVIYRSQHLAIPFSTVKVSRPCGRPAWYFPLMCFLCIPGRSTPQHHLLHTQGGGLHEQGKHEGRHVGYHRHSQEQLRLSGKIDTVNWLIDRLIDWLIDWLNITVTARNSSVWQGKGKQSIGWLVDRLTDLIDWFNITVAVRNSSVWAGKQTQSIGWLADRLIDWFDITVSARNRSVWEGKRTQSTGWLIDWLVLYSAIWHHRHSQEQLLLSRETDTFDWFKTCV